MHQGIVERAADFIWRNARLLDRRRFHHLFAGGGRDEVLAALYAYQNPDGGFGHALEPDLRAPASQPVAAEMALRVLAEIGGNALMTFRLCGHLESISTETGAVPFVLSSAKSYPAAPWWQSGDHETGAFNPTASIAGFLYQIGVRHAWLERAATFCWRRLDGQLQDPHDFLAAAVFLDHVPDRERAWAVAARVGEQLLAAGAVTLEPAAPGYVQSPLDFAPAPASVLRPLFSNEVMSAHLDALLAQQTEDGGWPVSWETISASCALEWRGWQTVNALQTLKAYGRL
ncbi:MAG: hypothetical protein M1118_12305 [Chloroflexi bacterium]|nr:hypothetical protein [Chloroflexota bacterium]